MTLEIPHNAENDNRCADILYTYKPIKSSLVPGLVIGTNKYYKCPRCGRTYLGKTVTLEGVICVCGLALRAEKYGTLWWWEVAPDKVSFFEWVRRIFRVNRF